MSPVFTKLVLEWLDNADIYEMSNPSGRSDYTLGLALGRSDDSIWSGAVKLYQIPTVDLPA